MIQTAPDNSTPRAWHAVALIVIVFAAYSSALSAGWIWDDDYYVTENATLRSIDGLWRIWFERGAVPQYYPMTHTTFWVEYQLWGLRPVGYHVVNVALHSINAVLLWRLLLLLRVPGALIAAAVFGVHPIHVESVAWVTERKNVLSGCFYLLALLAYLKWIDFGTLRRTQADQSARATSPPSERMRSFALYGVSFGLFVLALLSKSVTSSLPAVVLLLIFGLRGRITWRDIWPLLPFFAMGIIAGWNTSVMEREVVGAKGPEWDFSLVERCLIAGRAAWFYAGKLLWPNPLIFTYPRWSIDATNFVQYLWPVTAIALVVLLIIMRDRWSRWPLVAVLFFGGTLVPALGFVDLLPMRYSFVADHFVYLASIGLIALFGAGVAKLDLHPVIVRGGVAIVVLALSIKTWTHGRDFADAETLWVNTIDKNADAWMARNNLAAIYLGQGKLDEAEDQLKRSLAIKPDNAEAVMNLGRVAALRNDPDRAIELFSRAARINPNYAPAYYNLGVSHGEAGNVERAVAAYERAIDLNPQYGAAINNLSALMFQTGQTDRAIWLAQRALDVDPANASAHRNLANALDAIGRAGDAGRHRRIAESLDPENAVDVNNEGIRLAQQGDLVGALRRFDRAAELRPDLHEAHLNRGIALEKLGRRDEAIDAYRRAQQLSPADPRATQALDRLQGAASQ